MVLEYSSVNSQSIFFPSLYVQEECAANLLGADYISVRNMAYFESAQ